MAPTKAERPAPSGNEAAAFVIEGRRFAAPALAPGLYVTATPIGNLEDVGLRALKVLAAADRIVCEDTRVTGKLLRRYGIDTPMLAYHDHNAAAVRPRILAGLADGKALALASDAGMPLISDPGLKLVKAALEAGHPVTCVPGPSAGLTGLVLSGLATDRFHFEGFLAAKAGARKRRLAELAPLAETLVVFESARRVRATLGEMIAAMGDRPAALARELTKLNEEVIRAPLSGILAQLETRETLKGELVLVIAGAGPRAPASDAEVDALLRAALATMSVRDAADRIAAETGRPRRAVYARALALAKR